MNKDYSLDEISGISKEVLACVNHRTLLFYGEMGVGKTTLIKEICKNLGVTEGTRSPTFSIVNEYVGRNNMIIYHFDFYRIEKDQEAYDIGIEDYLYSGNLCLVEWPENIKNLVYLDTAEIHLSLLDNGKRNIQVKNTV